MPRRPVKKISTVAPAPAYRLKPKAIAEIFRRFHERVPEPTGELVSVNAYTFLVAVVLSAQTTDAGVNKATGPLFEKIDSPQKMLLLGEEKLQQAIRTIGLYRAKARNVIALSQQLIERFGGDIPNDRDALETLPGVGRKTANVVMNNVFKAPTMGVDTHVFRVSNRTGLAHGETPVAIEEQLLKVIPEFYLLHAHHWLILHGRYTCLARKPLCPDCLIRDLCLYPFKTTENELKNVKPAN